jgi:solute carrier family 25 carnitine/acylcarnitine transporter 20/29
VHEWIAPDRPLNAVELATAGGFAGFATSFAVAPAELLRTKLQAQCMLDKKNSYNGVIDCAYKTFARGGVPGMFTGLFATIARDVPGYASQFWMYETLKVFFSNRNRKKTQAVESLHMTTAQQL